MKTKSRSFRYGYNAGDLVSSALSGWLYMNLVYLIVTIASGEGLETLHSGVQTYMRNFLTVAVYAAVTVFFVIVFAEVIALSKNGRRVLSVFLLSEYIVFSVLTALDLPASVSEIAFLAAVIVFLIPILLYVASAFRENGREDAVVPTDKPKAPFAPVLIFGVAVACVFGGMVAAIGVMRYLGYSAPNFDFGIFCQMYADMAKTGTPVTTVERDGLLSHFAVHTSPVLYLLLPFYYLFRTPITLAVGQAVILYSGVVPLLLIGRRRGLSNPLLVLLSIAYAAYPAIGTGCFYDFHENCFLLPLLLWTFWFSECRRPIPFYIFALLTLSVKEDAFVYLAIYAVYLFLGEKRWKTALPLMILSLGYFLLVSHLMKQNGEGVMSWRYSNLLPSGESGLLGVVVTVFTQPGYVLTQIFSSSARDAGKFKYIGALLLPLGGLPCVSRKPSRWILLTPLLLNLLTMYVYQPNINFQYSFGIIAFLFYAATLNLSDLSARARSFTVGSLVFSAAACVVAFSLLVAPMIPANADHMKAWKDRHDTITETLAKIPNDASVAATTFLVPHLSQHKELYETYYHTSSGLIKTDCDYYVFDLRYGSDDRQENQINRLKSNGYREVFRDDGAILVLTRLTAAADPFTP